ncbi:hypothetical protein [Actinokineospora iranica]|uniref:Uncharacterized protein n=1 Tax=Actinokineospora iranica TaxID=1271860 RepID=A0A1G6WQL4_9PSEU|nr:hypothetical protein [Actinokineospora iranica]SDD68162.1 hypothetical protein SAMN05216174_115127 [Actinokineospora iranica]
MPTLYGLLTAVLALLGALGGAWLTSRAHAAHARTHAALQFTSTQVQTVIKAAAQLLTILDRHRSNMEYLEESRGNNPDEQQHWQREVESSRDAMNEPLLLVCCLMPGVAHTAEAAVTAAYAMHNTGTHSTDTTKAGTLEHATLAAKTAANTYKNAVIATVHSLRVGDSPVPLVTEAQPEASTSTPID